MEKKLLEEIVELLKETKILLQKIEAYLLIILGCLGGILGILLSFK